MQHSCTAYTLLFQSWPGSAVNQQSVVSLTHTHTRVTAAVQPDWRQKQEVGWGRFMHSALEASEWRLAEVQWASTAWFLLRGLNRRAPRDKECVFVGASVYVHACGNLFFFSWDCMCVNVCIIERRCVPVCAGVCWCVRMKVRISGVNPHLKGWLNQTLPPISPGLPLSLSSPPCSSAPSSFRVEEFIALGINESYTGQRGTSVHI